MAEEYIEREVAKARLRMWITDCVLAGDNDAADCFRDCIDLLDSIPSSCRCYPGAARTVDRRGWHIDLLGMRRRTRMGRLQSAVLRYLRSKDEQGGS